MSLLHIAGGATEDKLYVEDVFSTYLYTGNGSTQTINNGIDLAGKGGLVWIKSRSVSANNTLIDTVRGVSSKLASNTTGASTTTNSAFTSFNSGGFSLAPNDTTILDSTYSYVSWTLRKAPKFFDVQTKVHTNGTASTVDLSTLGTVGMVVVKATTTTGNWYTWHTGLTAGNNLKLNLTDAQSATNAYLSVSGTTLTIASTAPSATYVIHAYANDPSADGLIQCGSFTTASGNATVNLGWEPQFLLAKPSNSVSFWWMVDQMRSFGVSSGYSLSPNSSNAESTSFSTGQIKPTATGFQLTGWPLASETYIYLAIRRPMKVPTDGTSVFAPVVYTGNGGTQSITSNFPVDLAITDNRTKASAAATDFKDRLRGKERHLGSQYTYEEQNETDGFIYFDRNVNVGMGVGARTNGDGVHYVTRLFRRAPGFFDIVCYTGTGVARTVNHSLGVVPELIIAKERNGTGVWNVIHNMSALELSNSKLNTSEAAGSAGYYSGSWLTSKPTTTSLPLGFPAAYNFNNSTATYVMYLFATLPGVSKVGSYTGNGSSQTINCGFSSGARFILIKRTDSTGDWYIWDIARGIVAANDPHLSLNTTAAEVTTDDSIDPASSGFIVNQNTATNINVNGASYIFLAIA